MSTENQQSPASEETFNNWIATAPSDRRTVEEFANAPNTSIGFDIDQSEKLAKLEEIGIQMPIDDITGRPAFQQDGVTPITITLVGSLSKRYRKVQAIQRGKVLRSVTKTATDTETDEQLGERSLTEQTEAVAACITGWSAGFTSRGKEFAYSETNAVRLLKANPHIQRKAEKWMDEHARFFAQSSTDSPT